MNIYQKKICKGAKNLIKNEYCDTYKEAKKTSKNVIDACVETLGYLPKFEDKKKCPVCGIKTEKGSLCED